MTKDEALKLSLEFITASNQRSEFWLVPSSNLNKTVTAIREALAQLDVDRRSTESKETFDQQEPVAWLHTKIEGVAVPHRPADLDKHPDRWEALYKTPPPCPTCEALARTVMLDQTYHDAQRKPLTDKEIEREWQFLHDEEGNSPDHHDFARAIEAVHGIKD